MQRRWSKSLNVMATRCTLHQRNSRFNHYEALRLPLIIQKVCYFFVSQSTRFVCFNAKFNVPIALCYLYVNDALRIHRYGKEYVLIKMKLDQHIGNVLDSKIRCLYNKWIHCLHLWSPGTFTKAAVVFCNGLWFFFVKISLLSSS